MSRILGTHQIDFVESPPRETEAKVLFKKNENDISIFKIAIRIWFEKNRDIWYNKKIFCRKLGNKMIKFEDVFFQYSSSKKTALSNINLEIKEGRWLSVLGKNGSGKSTLMKLIYGQNLATSGKVTFNNKEYNKELYDDIKNKIAIVFQNPDNQFVGSTVEEDIAFGLENRNVPQEKMDEIIDRVLEIVDMTDYRKYEPSSLSGGQKQRVAIASSLALDPEILILDEATSMLDPKLRSHILEYIKK